ncbi:unnamed protein product [Bursaphelenchus xylophilus]|uniref:(pine wood nematode) hypothetical protein n=1 Tax=Bursaphelenchus xylophilus TaxID=6326 RepID=A0A1I7S921_BURXY|nr:unnamed protein product [Bursaphelenchus xylophilus]CAG9086160.1 unnamed protein product [Bursaphelenchus xylophilus]
MGDQGSSNPNFRSDLSSKNVEPTQEDGTVVEDEGDEQYFQDELHLPDEIPDEPAVRREEAEEVGDGLDLEEGDPYSGSTDRLLEFCARYGVKPIVIVQLLYFLSLSLFLFIGVRRSLFRYDDVLYQLELDDMRKKIYIVSAFSVDLVMFVILPLVSAVFHSLTLLGFYRPRFTRFHKTKPSRFVKLLAVPQILVVAHYMAEIFVFLPEFFVKIESIWSWALVTFDLAIFSLHCFLFNLTFGIAEIDDLLYTWSLERLRRTLRVAQ